MLKHLRNLNLLEINLPKPTYQYDKLQEENPIHLAAILCSAYEFAEATYINPIQMDQYMDSFPKLLNLGFFHADVWEEDEMVYVQLTGWSVLGGCYKHVDDYNELELEVSLGIRTYFWDAN